MKSNASSDCELCHGTGFVWLPPHDRYPNGAYAICPCRLRAQRRRRMAELMSRTGLNEETMARWSFDTFDPAAALADAKGIAQLVQIKAACVAYARDPQGWLVLCGAYGCGKSHLAYATAAACHQTGRAVYVSTVPDLLETLRDGYAATQAPAAPPSRAQRQYSGAGTLTPATTGPALSFSARLALVCDADLLVLDDLGAQHDTPWSAEKLYQIIDHRYRRRLPLIVTTNVNLYDPKDRIEPRVLSRILDGANLSNGFARVVLINARDFRQRAPARPQQLAAPLSPSPRHP